MADGMPGPASGKRRISLIFFDAGGGHRNAATALQVEIERQGLPFEVLLVNLQEVLDPLDILRRLTGIRIQDLYNKILRHGWTLGSPQLMRCLQLIIRLYHHPSLRLLKAFWLQTQPDMVVSVVPHFNRALGESFAQAFPGRPFVTVLTDLADYPEHFWIERQAQFLVCGTERAVEQAHGMGYSDKAIFKTTGMILHPRFYEPEPLDRVEERKKLGLDPQLPTGIVLFGGYGTSKMLKILRQIDASPLSVQLILICGRNEKLTRTLRETKTRIPIHVEGFTTNIPCRFGGGARLSAGLRPPLKLHVRFSRMQLSRRSEFRSGTQRRNQRNQADQPQLATKTLSREPLPPCTAPTSIMMRPQASHHPAIKLVEESPHVG